MSLIENRHPARAARERIEHILAATATEPLSVRVNALLDLRSLYLAQRTMVGFDQAAAVDRALSVLYRERTPAGQVPDAFDPDPDPLERWALSVHARAEHLMQDLAAVRKAVADEWHRGHRESLAAEMAHIILEIRNLRILIGLHTEDPA